MGFSFPGHTFLPSFDPTRGLRESWRIWTFIYQISFYRGRLTNIIFPMSHAKDLETFKCSKNFYLSVRSHRHNTFWDNLGTSQSSPLIIKDCSQMKDPYSIVKLPYWPHQILYYLMGCSHISYPFLLIIDFFSDSYY